MSEDDDDFRTAERVHIEDGFCFLVTHVGCISARYLNHYQTIADHWIVDINGRRFVDQPEASDTHYTFVCKTEHGTVTVSFPLYEAPERGLSQYERQCTYGDAQ